MQNLRRSGTLRVASTISIIEKFSYQGADVTQREFNIKRQI